MNYSTVRDFSRPGDDGLTSTPPWSLQRWWELHIRSSFFRLSSLQSFMLADAKKLLHFSTTALPLFNITPSVWCHRLRLESKTAWRCRPGCVYGDGVSYYELIKHTDTSQIVGPVSAACVCCIWAKCVSLVAVNQSELFLVCESKHWTGCV